MSIQTDLQTVTDQIIDARRVLANAEIDRINARHDLAYSENVLDLARRAAMVHPDAGTNDATRRAYADYETHYARATVLELQQRVTTVEVAVVARAAALRMHEDRRRYLETVVTLTVNRAANDALHIAYADNGDRDPIGVLPTLNGDGDEHLPY